MSSRGTKGGGRDPLDPLDIAGGNDPDPDDDSIEIVEVVGLDENPERAGSSEPQPDPVSSTTGENGDSSTIPPSALQQAIQLKDKYYDMLLRKQADFDNYRKRSDRDRKEANRAVAAEVICTILPVLDNMERALSTSDASEGGLREGVVLIHQQLLDVLRKEGLNPLSTDGARFDPHLHEAVEVRDVQGCEKGVILEEMQKGYMFKDKLIRPALVKVASGRTEEPSEGGSGEHGA